MELKQNTPEWLAHRKNCIGASDIAAIIGVSPWITAFDLWEIKMGLKEVVQNAAMKRGQDMEEIARLSYIFLKGEHVAPVVLTHKERPFMIASLDGYNAEIPLAVEIKCGNKQDHLKAGKKGIIPDKYYPQLQHQIEVAGLDSIDYFSYYPDLDPVVIKVERNQEYIDNLLAREAEFYDCMLNFTPPKTH